MEGEVDTGFESNNLDFEHVDPVDPPVSSTTGDDDDILLQKQDDDDYDASNDVDDEDLYSAGDAAQEPDSANLLNFSNFDSSPKEKPVAEPTPVAPPKSDPFEPDISSTADDDFLSGFSSKPADSTPSPKPDSPILPKSDPVPPPQPVTVVEPTESTPPPKPVAEPTPPPKSVAELTPPPKSVAEPTPPPKSDSPSKSDSPVSSSGCSLGGSTCCSWLKCDPKVVDLIYWRDVKKTGVVFGSTMITLLALAIFSVVSVLAYLALAVMMVTLSFCVYKKVLGAVQKSQDGHPFKQYLEMNIALPEERVHQVMDMVIEHVNCLSVSARRLIMVEDLVDSIKFALLLWVFTYIGSWFNGLTLIILATVVIFSAPKVYETHQTQIDNYLELALGHVKKIYEQVKSKIPLPGKQKAQ